MRMTMSLALALLVAPVARAGEPITDDPVGRMRAMRLIYGERTPEQQLAILRAAEQESARSAPALRGAAATTTSALSWVNIGPTTADFELNGSEYVKVDSGRARSIQIDPRDANVVYFATAGGGVWKSFDALTPITSTTGPHWEPITESIGSLSVGAFALNPAAPDILLLGLGDPFAVHTPGMLYSTDAGATWSSANALIGSYDGGATTYTATSVRQIGFEPTGGALVFAATDAGLFRSQEGGLGTAWTLMRPNGSSLQDCWSVVYAGPHTFVASCIDVGVSGAGKIYYTTDDGTTWHTSSLSDTNVSRISLAAGAQALGGGGWRVYALAANNNSSAPDQEDAFISSDAGASFLSLNLKSGAPASPAANGSDVDQNNLDFLHDQATYNQMLIVDPVNPDVVFIGGNLCMGRSTNAGTDWTLLTDWLPISGRFPSWTLDQYAHADWHAAAIAHVGTTAYFYGGTDGGMFRSTDDGSAGFLTSADNSAVWEDRLNRGIVSHLLYSVVTGNERPDTSGCHLDATAADIVFGGLQDNGTRLRVQASGATPYVGFNQVAGGDGFGVAIGCNGTGALGSTLLSTYVSRISVADDGLTSSGKPSFSETLSCAPDYSSCSGLSPAIILHPYYTFVMKLAADLQDPAGRTFLTPLTDYDPNNPGAAIHGHVYRSTDGGHSWNGINGTIHRTSGTTVTSFPTPGKNIAAHPKVRNMYVATMDSRVYVTANGGTDWYESPKMQTDASDGGAYLSLETAAFDASDTSGNTVWVGSKATQLSGYSTNVAPAAAAAHVFKCTAMLTTPVCTATSTGIPAAVPVNVVKTDPNNSGTIYVGTEIGLYRSTNGGATFGRYGNNLPLVSVTDLAVAYDGSSIRIATYGRGFWEIYPKAGGSPAGVPGNGDFDASQTIDGFDVVREAAQLLLDNTSDAYNGVGNLTGATNSIDASDFAALVNKLGGRP